MKKLLVLSLILCGLCACSSSKKVSASAELPANDSPGMMPERLPLFQGKPFEAFREWVSRKVRYPDQIVQDYVNGILPEKTLRGRVVATFVIDQDGNLVDIEILSSPHPKFSQAVIDVMSRSPRWTPGYQRGEFVRVRFTNPVDFNLREEYVESLRRQRGDKLLERVQSSPSR
jgi:protein TonB